MEMKVVNINTSPQTDLRRGEKRVKGAIGIMGEISEGRKSQGKGESISDEE